MATARTDPLRSTLDNLQLDPRSEADRPYLVAMLRRLGYTEREIEEVVRTGQMPTQAPADDGLAPPRDYRLVVPARDSRFALDNVGGGAPATDSPFEDLEHVEFEDPTFDVVFEEVDPMAPVGAPDERVGEGLEWQRTQEGELPPEDAAWTEPAEEVEDAAQALANLPKEGEPGFEEGVIDTFGGADIAARSRTRVRVKRVRAASREEAERKVAGGGRNVIKSVPVDIVERWGPGGAERPKGGSGSGGQGGA